MIALDDPDRPARLRTHQAHGDSLRDQLSREPPTQTNSALRRRLHTADLIADRRVIEAASGMTVVVERLAAATLTKLDSDLQFDSRADMNAENAHHDKNSGSAAMRGRVKREQGSGGVLMPEPQEVVNVDLTGEERFLLNRGLVEWGGPARCTDAMAVAMVFTDVQDLFRETDRILTSLDAGDGLSRWDWTRTLIPTEIVFASDVIGSGTEWTTTTDLDDVRSLEVLRSIQHKLSGVRVPLGARVMDERH